MNIEERNQLIEDNIKLAPYAARMYCNMIPRYELDDVVAIANLAMVRSTDRYTTAKGTYANYMTRCIFNAIGHVKSGETSGSRKDTALSLDNEVTQNPEYGAQSFHEFIPSQQASVEGQIVRKVYIEQMLSTLKPRHREIVELYYYDGLTHDEISQRYGVTCSRIGQIINTSLKKMREIA